MKNIKLISLTLRNFKGIREFVLDARGENVSIYGDNATGKTTLFDAFTWLLFDKDSHNNGDPQKWIKTLDENNNVLNGLEHEVEGVFTVNEKEITLKKVFAEKWTKKRGSATAEFTGHTTNYYINDVPSKKTDYTNKVSEIMKEETFKLLTNPAYFNEQLNWKKRREILIEICGDITDQEVIESNKALSQLPDILNVRSIEDHQEVLASKRSKINKELDRIPVRIDEVQRSMPDVSGLSEHELNDEIQFLKSEIEQKESEIIRIRSGGEISNKEKRIHEIEAEMLHLKNEQQKADYDKIAEKQRELSRIKQFIESSQFEAEKLGWQIEECQKEIEAKEAEMSALRKKWTDVNECEFKQESQCPTCGQSLPEEQRNAALEHFNLNKSEQLQEIRQTGQSMAKEVAQLKQQIQSLHEKKSAFEKHIKDKKRQLETTQSEITRLETSTTEVESNPAYENMRKELQSLKQEIEGIRSSSYEVVAEIEDEIHALKIEIEKLEQEKAKFEQIRQAEQRIEELQRHERTLADEYEKLEQELYLTEEFIRTKVNMLEEKINDRFKYARFKLFDQQINGRVSETCETLYEGVPYSKGLNNAARINVGLDIINTLSEHYGISAPIFIDNREAVTKLIETKGQLISLVVSEKDKKLRVETIEKSMREEV